MSVDKRDEDVDSSCSWSREEDKAFENAIASYNEDSLDRWEKIAADVPGKSLEEIKEHYELLINDIADIDSGRVPLPCYISVSDGSSNVNSEASGKRGGQFGNFSDDLNHGGKCLRSDQERRKGIAWTEDEHRLFLLGLEKYGKGDWRSISRNFVLTRTPTQVASHAQKYFIRLNSMNKERRRSSIHDITSVNDGDVSQGPITGQTNSPATGASSGKQSKSPNPTSPPVSAVSIYGAPTIGQPVGPLASAVGKPVNLQPPALMMAYGMRSPIHGPMIQGGPANVGPMTYPMTHSSGHQ